MFKKRRQRSKKYTLTSYGSVDEDMQQDSQEEDSQFLGSESEVDEEGFSAAPDPTWDSDYLDILEKRSVSRGLEENDVEDSLSTGLSDTTGKGAKLFEQQRKRAKEQAKKISFAPMQSLVQSEIQAQEIQTQPSNLSVQVKKHVRLNVQPPPVAPKPPKPLELIKQEEACASKAYIAGSPSQVTPPTHYDHTASITGPVHTLLPVTNQPITAVLVTMPPPTTPLPELPSSSVLNRTARPFAPGFIGHRAATAPVVFRPNTAKKTPRPVSVAMVAPSFLTPSDEKIMVPAEPSPSFTVSQISATVPLETSSTFVPVLTEPLPHSSIPDTAASLAQNHLSSMEDIQPSIVHTVVSDSSVPAIVISGTPSAEPTNPTSISSIASSQSIAPESSIKPVAPISSSVPPSSVTPMTPLSPVSYREKATEGAHGTVGKTGILQESRRRSAIKPMFKVFENKKNSPNPELLSMVQNLDDCHKHTDAVSFAQDSYNFDDRRGRIAPPVAPKPRIIPEMSQIPQAEGKGAELFARRQNRRDLFVIDSFPPHPQHQQQFTQPYSATAMIHPCEPSPWKYSSNVRAPPPIGYNPLLSPSCPLGLQRGGTKSSEKNTKTGKSAHGFQKEGIRAIDVMRRQPYQLNSAMFRFGGDSNTQSIGSSYQRQPQVGHTLSQPRQVPVKAARVYEIKRFSTPTPMSAPTIRPTVIAPRAQTTLAEPLCRSDMTSPTPAPVSPPPQPVTTSISVRTPGLPELPRISATPIFLPTPYSPPCALSSMSSLSSHGLQATKQFKSAPELSSLPPVSMKPSVQAPKPRFIATRVGIQPHVWRPGAV